ncbi:MAG: endonuclease domain-containing protein [Candidatus Kapabacteria bacterium]|nr:endonuclease domain-containing protein [Candidatus Kapabacteria bacterium]
MIIHYEPELIEYARRMRNHPTNGEKVMWSFLKGKQMLGYDFHRQKPIGYFIADFYCSKLDLVIEVDGISHEDVEVQQNDKNKDRFFAEMGLSVLRFTDEEVLGNPNAVEKKIKEFILKKKSVI